VNFLVAIRHSDDGGSGIPSYKGVFLLKISSFGFSQDEIENFNLFEFDMSKIAIKSSKLELDYEIKTSIKSTDIIRNRTPLSFMHPEPFRNVLKALNKSSFVKRFLDQQGILIKNYHWTIF